VRRWQAFTTLCEYLRAGFLGATPSRRVGHNWELIVEISNQHHVAAAVDWCLRHDKAAPAKVRDYFDAIRSLNAARNEVIAGELLRVLELLYAIGVRPILLKGAAHLAEELYPPGTRIIGDVDVLINEIETEAAVRCLLENGFTSAHQSSPEGHHHLPMLHDSRSGLGVELHTRVERDAAAAILPTDWFVLETRTLDFRGLDVQLPNATRLVGHNIVHSQLNHENHESGRTELRQLLDLAMLRAKHESTINWDELEKRFEQAGQGQALAAYLALNSTLLGQEFPNLSLRPDKRALQKVRNQIDPQPHVSRSAVDVVSHVLPIELATQHAKYCWRIDLPDEFLPGNSPSAPKSSPLEFFEGRSRLGPAHASHSLIQEQGRGAFSHWDRTLFFSTSDNSDPRTTGREYSVQGWVPRSANILAQLSAERIKAQSLSEKIETLSENIEHSQAEQQATVSELQATINEVSEKLRILSIASESSQKKLTSNDFVSFELSNDQAVHIAGHCYLIKLPDCFISGDDESDHERSDLELFENGTRLGPAHALHDFIKANGRGAYSHWGRHLFFSTLDNGDPRNSNATYRIRGWVHKSAKLLETLVAERAARAADTKRIAALQVELAALKETPLWRLRKRILGHPYLYRALRWFSERSRYL